MQKAFLLFVVFSVSFCLKSVGQSNIINITFDDNSYKKYVVIDTTSSFRWQVCKTNKAGFGSGTSTKVIVTDSSKSYPKNDTMRFIVKFDSLMYLNGSLVQGVIEHMYFNFAFRMNTDSSKDFCQLDFSYDNGNSWFLANQYSCVSSFSFNNNWSDSALISGKLINWNIASFFLNPCGCFPARIKSGSWPQIYATQNSIWFRFSLLTDSTYDSLPGCEIDSISFQRIWWQYCPTGIENISSQIPITIFPNPSSSNFNLTTDETIAAKGFGVSITNLLGENIFSKNDIHQANFKIDTQQFPAGIYFLKSHCSGYADANEKLVVEK
ncbi:MAG: Secretion system C-terminal sorting domain [Bacteroidota bacterium]|jgi:hypothetical protein